MPVRSRWLRLTVLSCSVSGILLPHSIFAHTNSIGYENAGAGSVTFWFGTYHNPVNFTEGSFNVTGGAVNTTVPFSLLVNTKPGGLIDGTTNFYAGNPNNLVGVNPGQAVRNWQGVTINGLTQGTYTFTYIPIANPTQEWQPLINAILSNTVTLSASVVGGGGGTFTSNSTSAGVGAAGVLDSLVGNATGSMADAIVALQAMNTQTQHVALQHITPETNRAVGQSSSMNLTGVLDSVAVRLENIRVVGYGTTVAEDLESNRRVLVAANGDFASLASGDKNARHSFWTKAFGAHAEQQMQDGFAGYIAGTAGVSVGTDVLLESQWLVGAAFTVAKTDVSMRDFRQGDSADIASYQGTAYAARDFGAWYLEGMLAYAYQSYDSTRDTAVAGLANAEYDGDQWAARISAGRPFPLAGNWRLTPTLGVEWNHLRTSGYRETGGGPLGLEVKAQSADRLRSAVGLRLSTELETNGYTLRPSVHAVWRHEFQNDGIDSTATFTGGGATFTTPGQTLDRNTYNLGGQLAITRRRNFELSLRVDVESASHYVGYAGQAMARWSF